MAHPAVNDLEIYTPERFAVESCSIYLIYAFVFISVGICGILLFGSRIDIDLLISLGELNGNMAIASRFLFCFVLLFHIPYYFQIAKECLLVTYDEIRNRSLTNRLDIKLASLEQDKEAINKLEPYHKQDQDDKEPLLFEDPRELDYEFRETEQTRATSHLHS